MRNLMLIIGLFVFTSTLFTGKAIAQESKVNSSEERMLIYNEKGIVVYFNEIYKMNAPVYLEVEIENTNEIDIEISWEVKDKQGVVQISETSKIKAKSTFRNVNSNSVIEIMTGLPMSDFTFEIK